MTLLLPPAVLNQQFYVTMSPFSQQFHAPACINAFVFWARIARIQMVLLSTQLHVTVVLRPGSASSGFYCFLANNLCSKSNSFVYIETGTCEDVANRKSLYTNEDCNFAAGALQLVDTSSILLGTNAGNVPRGCSTNIGTNNVGLVVNPFPGSAIRCSKTYKCLCQLGSACTNTDGTAVNSLPCICGSNFCTTNTGLVCGKCCKIVLVLKVLFLFVYFN